MSANDYSKNLGILLLAFGGPESIDAVEPFLKSVLSGRLVSKEQINRAVGRYKAIGGKSPLLDITVRQAKALENELGKTFRGMRVYVGMRHWHPYIKDTLREMVSAGTKKAVAVSLAPQNSKASTGAYKRVVEEALQAIPNGIKVDFVQTWHNNPLFLKALSRRINEGLLQFAGKRQGNVHIIFSAHSLPKELVEDDPYVEQLNETINGVIGLIGFNDFTLAYQSKGGGSLEWLQPDVGSVLEKIAQKGTEDVLLVPVGFVSDHVETLYDIDVIYKKKAQSLNLNFRRTKSFNDSSDFINVLAGVVLQTLRKKEGIA